MEVNVYCRIEGCSRKLNKEAVDFRIKNNKFIEYTDLYCTIHGYNHTIEIHYDMPGGKPWSLQE